MAAENCIGISDTEELAATHAALLVDVILWIDRDVHPTRQ